MHELSYVSARRAERFRALGESFPSHLDQIEAEQAAYTSWYRGQRRRRRLAGMLRLWPVAAGLILGGLAAPLGAFLTRWHPWCMWVVFPFTLLAHRPEIAVNEQLARTLPRVILNLQFPLEGLVALLAVRRRVTIPGVTGQIVYFHFLGAMQLVMVTGLLNPILIR